MEQYFHFERHLSPGKQHCVTQSEELPVTRRNMNSNASSVENEEYVLDENTKEQKTLDSSVLSRYLPIRCEGKRINCPDCNEKYDPKVLYYHRKFFCGRQIQLNLSWHVICHTLALCLKCKTKRKQYGIVLHTKYTCGKKLLRCFFCDMLFQNTKKTLGLRSNVFLYHLNYVHGKHMHEIEESLLEISDEALTKFNETGECALIESMKYDTKSTYTYIADCRPKVENTKDTDLKLLLPNFLLEHKNKNENSIIQNFDGVFVRSKPIANKVLVNNKILKSYYISCPNCSKSVHIDNLRLHKKYYCMKDPDKIKWNFVLINKFQRPKCLKCNRSFHPQYIEFHASYICGKQSITVQCFYCTKLVKNYNSLIGHMKSAHRKVHCLLDLISILPEPPDVSESTEKPNESNIVVRHYFGSSVPLNDQSEKSSTDEKETFVQNQSLAGLKDNKCFYCSEQFTYLYETLDHMEEAHSMKPNTYDVLKENIVRMSS